MIPKAPIVIILEKLVVETVIVPVFEAIFEKRLKYISPEVPLTEFKVTFEIYAGEIILIISFVESKEEYTCPLKIITLSD